MKKIIVLILLLISAVSYGQQYGAISGKITTYTDSLYYGTPGDSVHIYKLDGAYEWISLVLKGNSNTTADSIVVKRGTIGTYANGNILDTAWTNMISFKDSSWTSVNVLKNNTVGVHYTAFEPIIQLIKIYFINARTTDTDRKTYYRLQVK